MNHNQSPEKVINLTNRLADKKKGVLKKKGSYNRKANPTRVFAITSGKGGVGKTNIVANLAYALGAAGKRVLVLDGDLGLGNLDVLLGLAPKYNLSHIISGEKQLEDIIVDGPGNMKILPAASGIQELTRLTAEQKIRIFKQLDLLIRDFDTLLIDTGAGISSNVIDFNVTAQEIMVVVTPEPTSITDAYALMKVLSMRYAEKHCRLLINLTANSEESREIYRQLNLVAKRFLDISIEYTGYIASDPKLTTCVKRQKLVAEAYPDSPASVCFRQLARKMNRSISQKPIGENTHFFWEHLVQNQFA